MDGSRIKVTDNITFTDIWEKISIPQADASSDDNDISKVTDKNKSKDVNKSNKSEDITEGKNREKGATNPSEKILLLKQIKKIQKQV